MLIVKAIKCTEMQFAFFSSRLTVEKKPITSFLTLALSLLLLWDVYYVLRAMANVEVRGQSCGIRSLILSLHGIQESNLNPQTCAANACTHGASSTVLIYWPYFYFGDSSAIFINI